jgi:hypothetical protein
MNFEFLNLFPELGGNVAPPEGRGGASHASALAVRADAGSP